jgi:hypothetical protein
VHLSELGISTRSASRALLIQAQPRITTTDRGRETGALEVAIRQTGFRSLGHASRRNGVTAVALTRVLGSEVGVATRGAEIKTFGLCHGVAGGGS